MAARVPAVSQPTVATTEVLGDAASTMPGNTISTTTTSIAGRAALPTTTPSVVAATEVTGSVDAPRATTAPVDAAEDTETTTANRSTCRSDLPAAAMTITITDISYTCPVYAGGQSLLDTGAITLITDFGTSPLLALHPADSGTLWIAGHRTSHGGPFADVAKLADGAVITVSDSIVTASYRVIGRAYVQVDDGLVIDAFGHATDSATQDSLLRTDRGGNLAPRLVLQTCDGNNNRWMIYADLIPT